MSKRQRRLFTPEKKAEIVKRHLVDKVAVSEICNENQLQPTQLYTWEKMALDGMPRAFDTQKNARPSREAELEAKIKALEARLAQKDSVIAEVTQELIAEKKRHGES